MDAATANAISGGITAFGRGLDMGNDLVRMRDKKKERDQIEYDRAFDERMVTAVTTMEASGDTTEAVKHLREHQAKSGIKEDSPTWIKAAEYDQKTGALKIQKNDGSIVEASRQEWDRWFPRTKSGATSSLDATDGTKPRKRRGIPSSEEQTPDPTSPDVASMVTATNDPASPYMKAKTEKQIRETLGTYFDLTAADADVVGKAVNMWKYAQEQGQELTMADIAGVLPALKVKGGMTAETTPWDKMSPSGPTGSPGGIPTEDQPIRGGPAVEAASAVGVRPAAASAPTSEATTSAQPKAEQVKKWTVAYQKALRDASGTDPAAKAKAQAWLNSDTGKRIKTILDRQE